MSSEVQSLVFSTGREVSLGLEKMVSSSGLTPMFETSRKAFFNELVKERPDYDSVQFALMERASYLQARIKQKESQGAYSSEQNYTMANRTFMDTINLLLKTDAEKEDLERQKRDFMEVVAESVKFAIKDLDDETQKSVLFLLSKKFEDLNG